MPALTSLRAITIYIVFRLLFLIKYLHALLLNSKTVVVYRYDMRDICINLVLILHFKISPCILNIFGDYKTYFTKKKVDQNLGKMHQKRGT